MPNLHIGTIGWSYNFWKGNFYPNKSASKDFLSYYATKFDTVEADSTFYRIPTEQAVINWKNQTSENFLFSFKFPSTITHIKMLKDCDRETKLFLEKTKLLEEKLGPLLLQFPPSFGIEHLSGLSDFLQKLPKENRYVIEVRDEAFFNDEFYSILQVNNVALAWVDSPNISLNDKITSDFLYIRWEGDRAKVNGTLGKIEVDKTENLKQWAEKIKPFMIKNIKVYGYFGKYYSGYPPSDINSLLKFFQHNI